MKNGFLKIWKITWAYAKEPLHATGLFIIVGAGLVSTLGFINQHATKKVNGKYVEIYSDNPLVGDFYANISAELASIAITVLILDKLSDKRQRRLEYKRQLIRQSGSTHNEVANTAIRELRDSGWLYEGSLIGMTLEKANLRGANLHSANLHSANLAEADLTESDLAEADLSRATLTKANLTEADLTEADLYGADLKYANLTEANLRRTTLALANLTEANLTRAILDGADFTGAFLDKADFNGADIRGACFVGTHVTDRQLAVAIIDGTTIMPNGEKWEPSEDA